MPKRQYLLDPLSTMQKKLEDFFQTKKTRLEGQQQANVAYMEAVYSYHKLGLSLTEISKTIGVPRATIHQWIKKIEKAKEQPQHAQV